VSGIVGVRSFFLSCTFFYGGHPLSHCFLLDGSLGPAGDPTSRVDMFLLNKVIKELKYSLSFEIIIV
jgi:hypothetical protein